MWCVEQEKLCKPHLSQRISFERIFCAESNLWNLQLFLKAPLSCLHCFFLDKLDYLGKCFNRFWSQIVTLDDVVLLYNKPGLELEPCNRLQACQRL